MEEERLERLEKKVQRALDLHEIQNVMAMHEYYHSANMHEEELNAIWARKTPGVVFEESGGRRYEGFETIKKMYFEGHQNRGRMQLQEMKRLYPWIEDDPKNEFIGKAVMHTLTTPCLEVAEDGQTAKGVWVSPGYLSLCEDGKVRAFWHYDKYGIDFVKEDGEWKIWHLHIFKVFFTPYEKSWVENILNPEPPRSQSVIPLQPNAPSTTPHYQPYSPFAVAQFEPRPPEPYRTFKETFSY